MRNKGITLIALVITIIVLLILAGISIAMLSGDNGILQRAGQAKKSSEAEQIKERMKLAYHSALAGGQWSYTKESLGDELEKEFGENNYDVDDSNDVNWILNAKNQSISIPAGVKVKVFAKDKLTLNKLDTESEIKSPYINYTCADGNKILCRLLYNDEKGLEIISADVIKSGSYITYVYLGMYDSTVTGNEILYTGKAYNPAHKLKGVASYNRLVVTLNENAEKYRNKTNNISIGARSVGSNRDMTDTSSYYHWREKGFGYYAGNDIVKVSDSNYTSDLSQMEKLGISRASKTYYLASRKTNEEKTYVTGYVRVVGDYPVQPWQPVITVDEMGNFETRNVGFALRVVFNINPDAIILSGDGTEKNPFELCL